MRYLHRDLKNLRGRDDRLYHLFVSSNTLHSPMIFIQILYYIFLFLSTWLVDLHTGSGRCCIPVYRDRKKKHTINVIREGVAVAAHV